MIQINRRITKTHNQKGHRMLYVLALMVIFGTVQDVVGMPKNGSKYAGSSLPAAQRDKPIKTYDLDESLKRRPTFDQMNAALTQHVTKVDHAADMQALRQAYDAQRQEIALLGASLVNDRNMLVALFAEREAMGQRMLQLEQVYKQQEVEISRLVYVNECFYAHLQGNNQQLELLAEQFATQNIQLAQLSTLSSPQVYNQ